MNKLKKAAKRRYENRKPVILNVTRVERGRLNFNPFLREYTILGRTDKTAFKEVEKILQCSLIPYQPYQLNAVDAVFDRFGINGRGTF